MVKYKKKLAILRIILYNINVLINQSGEWEQIPLFTNVKEEKIWL